MKPLSLLASAAPDLVNAAAPRFPAVPPAFDDEREPRDGAARATLRRGEHQRRARLPRREQPLRGLKDGGLGAKEGMIEAMEAYGCVKAFSLHW